MSLVGAAGVQGATEPSPIWAKGLRKNGSYYEGFVDGLEILENHKRGTITTWGIRRSKSNKENQDGRIMWNYSGVSIENSPFQLVRKETRECQFGPHYFKRRKRTSSRVYIQGTRKHGCPAVINICEYKFYPQYALSEEEAKLTGKNLRLAREKKLKNLKDALNCGDTVQVKPKYFVSLPTSDSHEKSHPTGVSSGPAQKVHPLISKKIEDLVREGAVDPNEVQRSLREYVKNNCSLLTPSFTDRSYYPTVNDIRNHMYKAKIALQLSKFDQENLALKIKDWNMVNTDDCHMFRPYIKAQCSNSNDLPDDPPDDQADSKMQLEQSLLWIYQQKWQKDLMARYGNHISLIDATYRTMKYELPLFFVCVRTNVGYSVVAQFIVQSECTEQIAEALTILKEWNPEWNPPFFLSDFSDAEISAITEIFPCTKVYGCDFHREQAWTRWVQDKKNSLDRDAADSLLGLLRACAWAQPGEIQLDSNYQQAVSVLKASAVWKNNEHVRSYLNSQWLLHPERWARAFRDNEFHAAVDTNNGTEAQNKVLKYKYMPKTRASTLSSLVTLLVERYLPDAQQRYVIPNLQASEWYRKYNDFVPEFLRGRPRSVILHCMNRQSRSNKYTEETLSMGEEEGVFMLRKEDGSKHTVNFGKNSPEHMPSCSCKDWTRWHLPCKHFFAVFRLKEAWNWNKLPQSYLNSAYLSTDKDATDAFFNQISDSSNEDNHSTQTSNNNTMESEANSSNEPLQQSIPVKGPSVQVLGMTARATLHQIETLTYNITEKKILADLSANLKELYSNTYRLLPHKDGLVLRPRDQRQVTNMRRRVWKAKTLLKCSSLSYTKRKKRLPSSFRNRFGIKADRLRRANQNVQADLKAQKSKAKAGIKRAKRCGKCSGCTAEDCGTCINCKDMKKHGGPGRKKQCCVRRKCKKAVDDNEPSTSTDQKASEQLGAQSSLQEFLSAWQRKSVEIVGDGNCLFRAISYLLFGHESEHGSLRSVIVRFELLNSPLFEKRLTAINKSTLQEHALHMDRPNVWATHIEVFAVATFFQAPVYFCQDPPHPSGGAYKWECFSPIATVEDLRCPIITELCFDNATPVKHFELIYHANLHHYSCIVGGEIPPTISGTNTVVEEVIE